MRKFRVNDLWRSFHSELFQLTLPLQNWGLSSRDPGCKAFYDFCYLSVVTFGVGIQVSDVPEFYGGCLTVPRSVIFSSWASLCLPSCLSDNLPI